MRTRTIVTVTLLAAGCGRSGSSPSTATAASTPRPATTVMAVPAPVTAPSATAAPRDPAQLQQLATELRAAPAGDVMARAQHFRPLCDAEGYPLVGNLATKSSQPGPIESFCADVRTKPTP